MKLFSKIATLALGAAMAVGVGVAVGSKKVSAAHASDYTATLEQSGTAANYTDTQGNTWTVDYTAANTLTVDTGFLKVGSNSKAATSISLECNDFADYTIDKVTIHVKAKASTNAYGYIYIGGTEAKKTSSVLANSDTELVFDNSSDNYSGLVKVVVARASSATGALYLGTVSVEYSNKGGEGPYTVTYDSNGGTGTMTDSTEYAKDASVTVLNNTFTYSNSFYEFDSFNTKADGSGTEYAGGSSFTITSNVTLYAQWVRKEVTLPNGSYSSSIEYVNPMPDDLYIKNSSDNDVGLLEVQKDGLGYKTSYSEFDLPAGSSITLVNHSNATITKVLFEVYNFDNIDVFVDGSTTAMHSGDGSNIGDHTVIELEVEASTSVKIKCNGGSKGTYSQSFYGFEVLMKVGTDVVHPSSITLNATSGNVYIGKTRPLTATVLPADADDRSVSWSSSNTSVTTVDSSGLVSGVAAGSATITATTTDGGLTASFVATVKTISYGTLESPISVNEAREVLEATGSTETTDTLYVKGIVTASYKNSSSKYIVWLQNDDGSEERSFEVYNPSFSSSVEGNYSADDALNGLEIIASGKAKIYSSTTYEISSSAQIESVKYTVASFCAKILNDTKESCDAYVDGESDYDTYKATFTSVWSNLSDAYDTLTQDEKDEIALIDRSETGSAEEQAMLRYDFLTGKYGLDNFVEGRSPIVPAGSYIASYENNLDSSSSITIIVIVAVASMTLLGVTLVLRKRKMN